MPWPKAHLQEPSPTVSLASWLVPAHSLAEDVTNGQKEHCLDWTHQKSVLGTLAELRPGVSQWAIHPAGEVGRDSGGKVWGLPEPTLGPPGSDVGQQAPNQTLSPQFGIQSWGP